MIRVQNLTKYHGPVKILDKVNCSCRNNEIVVIVGPSGCGKTTLLRLIAGLEKPDGGQITIDNRVVSDPASFIEPQRRQVSLVFQDLALWPHMTVDEHIDFVLPKTISNREERKAKIDAILHDVSLKGYSKRTPHELSGGEQQRLAIARAIAPDPRYLLLDEPFSSLDTILKDSLLTLMRSIALQGKMGLICVTHNTDEAHILADRIAVMQNGRIVQFDCKEQLMENPKNEFVAALLQLRK